MVDGRVRTEADLSLTQIAAAADSQTGPPTAPQRIAVIPVLPGDIVPLPFDHDMRARLGPSGNLAVKSGNLTVILQGYVAADLQAPVTILAADSDTIDVAALLQATGAGLDIPTAIGGSTPLPPAAADVTGNGIFTSFVDDRTLGTQAAAGTLDATALLPDSSARRLEALSPPVPLTLRPVEPSNRPPDAADVALDAAEDGGSVTGVFLGSDPDAADQGKLAYAIVTAPATGTLIDNGDGTFTYDPGAEFQERAAGETQLVTASYIVTDLEGLTDAGLISITVAGINDTPVVQDLALAAEEGGLPVDGKFDGDDVDSDDDAASLTYSIVTPPGSGTVINNGDGTFTYDPEQAFTKLRSGESDAVTFTYVATDRHGAISNTGTVTVTITGTDNQAPTAADIALNAVEDGLAVGAVFVGDDPDPDDDPSTLGYLITTQPGEGAVVNNKDGSFSFDPGTDFQDLAPGETRDVTFKYRTVDSHGSVSPPANVTVTVTGINDAPVANDLSTSVKEGELVSAGFPADDIDSDDDATTLAYAIVTPPSAGNVTINLDGSFTFDTDGDFDDLLVGQTRIVNFVYAATDRHGVPSAPATVTITVHGANVVPPDPEACVPPADQLARYTYVAGTAGSDVLSPGGNNSLWIQAFGGDDVLVGSGLADLIEAGDGNDTLDAGGGNDVILAGAGNDTIQAGDASDCVGAGDGDDVVDGGNSNDNLRGDGGDDSMVGGDGEDELDGGDGNDDLSGGQGQDILDGGDGEDKLDGGEGDDKIAGGAGNDLILGGQGNDRDLNGDDGDDEIYGGQADDAINGGANNDKLLGEQGNDKINGNDGDDRIEGGQGDDHLTGGGGFDVIIGGQGHDTIIADGGDVVIQFVELLDAGDTIVNFDVDPAGGDTLDLDALFDSLEGTLGSLTPTARSNMLTFADNGGAVDVFIDADKDGATPAILLATMTLVGGVDLTPNLVVDSP